MNEAGPVRVLCTAEVYVSGYTVRCRREPQYTEGQHLGSTKLPGVRAADHPSPDGEIHSADVTLSWTTA